MKSANNVIRSQNIGGQNMCSLKVLRWIATLLIGLCIGAPAMAGATTIEDIAFHSQPGARLEVRLTFSDVPPADIESYSIEDPARIVLDFPGIRSALDQDTYDLSQANANSVVVLETNDRTRVVLNLIELVPFESRVEGRQLIVRLGEDDSRAIVSATATDILRTDANRVERVASQITDLAFQRSPEGEGLLILSMTNPTVDTSIFSEGGNITLEFLNTNINETLIRRFDVTDFATPVQGIDVSTTERGTRLQLRAEGLYDYLCLLYTSDAADE